MMDVINFTYLETGIKECPIHVSCLLIYFTCSINMTSLSLRDVDESLLHV